MIINKVEYLVGATCNDNFPKIDYPEIAIMGRSNVGKSSFINALVNRKNLAYISSKPGKTQTINFFILNDQIGLVDFPGYGYANRNLADRVSYGKMMEEYLKHRKNLKRVFLLIDFRHEPSDDDLLMYNYLLTFNIPITIVATKIDKIGKPLYLKQIKLIRSKFQISDDIDIILTSSEKHIGFDTISNLLPR